MSITTEHKIWRLCVMAYERGNAQGTSDRLAGYYNPSPLSGEWAAESPRELLGDLFDEAEQSGVDWDVEDEIMLAYEDGYADGNAKEARP